MRVTSSGVLLLWLMIYGITFRISDLLTFYSKIYFNLIRKEERILALHNYNCDPFRNWHHSSGTNPRKKKEENKIHEKGNANKTWQMGRDLTTFT